MRLLALDTATRQATVSVTEGKKVLAEFGQEVTTHSEKLLSLIDQALNRAAVTINQLDAIVCGRGPGSFTGLRIGMATAKGLCLAAKKPLLCISSLFPLAAKVQEELNEANSLTAVLLDARRGELYLGLYRGDNPLEPETLVSPQKFIDKVLSRQERFVLVGDGALAYRENVIPALIEHAVLAPEPCHAIQAHYLAFAALPRALAGDFDDLASAVPLYIRPSDAKLPQARKLTKPV